MKLVPSLDIHTTKWYNQIRTIIDHLGYVAASNEFVNPKQNVFDDIYLDITISDPSAIIPLPICHQRAKQIPIYTTTAKVESVVCQITDPTIAAARLTKSTIKNNNLRPSNPSPRSNLHSPSSNHPHRQHQHRQHRPSVHVYSFQSQL